jgi:hypothetical protein
VDGWEWIPYVIPMQASLCPVGLLQPHKALCHQQILISSSPPLHQYHLYILKTTEVLTHCSISRHLSALVRTLVFGIRTAYIGVMSFDFSSLSFSQIFRLLMCYHFPNLLVFLACKLNREKFSVRLLPKICIRHPCQARVSYSAVIFR